MGPTINIDPNFYQHLDYLQVLITSTHSCQVNAVFTFISQRVLGVDWMLAFTCYNFLYHGYVTLVTGLKKELFLFLMLTGVSCPYFLQHFLNFRQYIQVLQNLIDFVLLIYHLDFVIIQIFNKVDFVIFLLLFFFNRRLFYICYKRCFCSAFGFFRRQLS
jgi:hypothetical protein